MMRLLQDVSALVAANHPYSTPDIIFLPIKGGSDPYLQWLRDATMVTVKAPQ
jgi:periplasmic divalent cation tolerance protein